jgi:myo-inositol-1(or 4)-monophosphatase
VLIWARLTVYEKEKPVHTYREFALTLARRAGMYLKEGLNEKHRIDYKGEINIVTEADRMSEKIITSAIRETFPGHGILAEESTAFVGEEDCRWIIDPLDGTTNYAHGYPVFCVSIALEEHGAMRLGAVYNPMLDEMFLAEKGQGAFLNGRRIHVSATPELARALLATGFPYDIREGGEDNMNYFHGLALKAQAIRRAGAAALDLAYVAAGRFDGFWELKLMPWDTAAGTLLVREAGGVVTDLAGGTFSLSSPHVLASNGRLHEAMARVIADLREEGVRVTV